jgi:hypothetical protein
LLQLDDKGLACGSNGLSNDLWKLIKSSLTTKTKIGALVGPKDLATQAQPDFSFVVWQLFTEGALISAAVVGPIVTAKSCPSRI